MNKRLGTLTGLVLILLPQIAFAHNAFGDMGAFTNGFLHPLTTLQHVLVLLAFGMLLIVHRPLADKALGGLLLGFVLGLVVSQFFATAESATPVVVAMGLIIALTDVAAAKLSTPILVLLSGVTGLAMGSDSSAAAGVGDFVKFLCGALFALIVLQSYLLLMGLWIKKDWQRVALRILASWIATISLMYLAFASVHGA